MWLKASEPMGAYRTSSLRGRAKHSNLVSYTFRWFVSLEGSLFQHLTIGPGRWYRSFPGRAWTSFGAWGVHAPVRSRPSCLRAMTTTYVTCRSIL